RPAQRWRYANGDDVTTGEIAGHRAPTRVPGRIPYAPRQCDAPCGIGALVTAARDRHWASVAVAPSEQSSPPQLGEDIIATASGVTVHEKPALAIAQCKCRPPTVVYRASATPPATRAL